MGGDEEIGFDGSRPAAAFAVIVDAHREVDIFDRCYDEQCPEDKGQRAKRRGRVRISACEIEDRLTCKGDLCRYRRRRSQARLNLSLPRRLPRPG